MLGEGAYIPCANRSIGPLRLSRLLAHRGFKRIAGAFERAIEDWPDV